LLRRVALVRTDVSEEPGASFIRVIKIGELGTTQAATSNRRTLRRLMKEAPGSFETSVLTRATRRNNPDDTILHLISPLISEICNFITECLKEKRGCRDVTRNSSGRESFRDNI
jgi:hypothetical protein